MIEPKVVKVRSVDDFLSQSMSLPRQQWVFRGHSDSQWKIQSTANRYFNHNGDNLIRAWIPGRELEAIRKFQRASHHFLRHFPADNDILGWLAIMRHYGAPTRLIDFTYSPVTSLFFAYSDSLRDFDKSACIHAIHINGVMNQTKKVLGIHKLSEISQLHFFKNNDVSKSINDDENDSSDFVGFFDGRWDSPRQTAQQGLFMVTSRIETDVDEYLKLCDSLPTKTNNSPWIKYVFPKGRKIHKEVVKYLLSANQTHETLYPGLEGLAQSLSMKYYEPLSNTRHIFRG